MLFVIVIQPLLLCLLITVLSRTCTRDNNISLSLNTIGSLYVGQESYEMFATRKYIVKPLRNKPTERLAPFCYK